MVVSEGGLAMSEFLMDGIGDHIHILTADSIWYVAESEIQGWFK